MERFASASERILPLSDHELHQIISLIGPLRDEAGRITLPVAFAEHNPFRLGSRLRNWLMVAISRQCGHRRGEPLKTRLDDVPKTTDPGLKIRRRPHDSTDSRRYKPRVKIGSLPGDAGWPPSLQVRYYRPLVAIGWHRISSSQRVWFMVIFRLK